MKNSMAIFLAFVAGVTLTNVLWAVDHVTEIFLTGVPVVCKDSFPRYHTACIYSRPGLGEQAVTFEIDGDEVFHTEDFAAGNLKEDIFWDEEGSIVTFKVDGLGNRTFDAGSKSQISETQE